MYLPGSLCRLYFFLIAALHLLLVAAFLFPDEPEHASVPSRSPEQTEIRYKVSFAGGNMYARPVSVRGSQNGRKTDTVPADSVILSQNETSDFGIIEKHQETVNKNDGEEKNGRNQKTEKQSASYLKSMPAVHDADSRDTSVKTEKTLNRSGIDSKSVTENRHKTENKSESEKKKQENVNSEKKTLHNHPNSVRSASVRAESSSSASASERSAAANVHSPGVPGGKNQGTSEGMGKQDYPRDISSVEVVYRPRFEYPSQARRFGRQGMVVLILHVDSSGKVVKVDLEKSSNHSDLDRSAMVYGSDFRFRGITGGFRVRVPVLYRLK